MIQQFIITRFNFRGTKISSKKGENPLKEKSLKHRFKIFEMTCLPGVLNQTNQDFIWIIIVDSQLPSNYRSHLQKLISDKKEAFLVNYTPRLGINKLTWLKPFIKKGTKFINTIKIDDDDMLFDGYVQYCSDYLSKVPELEPITFMACGNELYWDFYISKKAPFGYLKRIQSVKFPSSAGFAVCCKYPEINFSIESFDHSSLHYLCNAPNQSMNIIKSTREEIDLKRKLLHHEIEKSKLAWSGRLSDKNFHIISTENPQTIIMNHLDNIQFRRVFTDHQNRRPVNPECFVSGFDVDFKRIEKQIVNQKKTLGLLVRLLKKHFLFTPNYLRNAGFFVKFKDRLFSARSVIAGFSKME